MLLLGPPHHLGRSRLLPRRLLRALAASGAVLTFGLLGAGLPGAAALAAPALAAPVFAAPTAAPLPAGVTAPTTPGVMTFGVQASSATTPDSRPHFTYTARPGVRILDYLAVSNYSVEPVTLHLYAGDAFTNNDGGFDLTPSADKPRDLGAWATIGNPSVTLAPRTRSILPFRLEVPANASPGDHTGGIIASLTLTNRDKKGDVVTVEHRLAERIYLRVPGAQRPSLAVQELAAAYEKNLNPLGQGLLRTRYRLVNDRNVRLGAQLSANVSDAFASHPLGTGQHIPELLPGSSISITAAQAGQFPLLRATAHVRVEPVNLGAPGDVKGAVVTASVGVLTLPVSALVTVAALLTVGAAARQWTKSRINRAPRGAPSSPRHSRSTGGSHASTVKAN